MVHDEKKTTITSDTGRDKIKRREEEEEEDLK